MADLSDLLEENRELNKLLQEGRPTKSRKSRLRSNTPSVVPYDDCCGDEDDEEEFKSAYCQFATGDGIRFFPTSNTVDALVPGIYDIMTSPDRGLYYQKIPLNTDSLLRFPETNSELIINEIKDFWEREHLFKEYGLSYRRGVLMWGPAGSGKSSSIKIIISDVVARNGVVFKFTHPKLFTDGLRTFREIQPTIPVVVLMEDIDSIIDTYNESDVLNILDGVDQFEKIVYLATTNYPEMLGERILNRPSRFDKRFKMGHPKAASRMLYFKHIIKEKTVKEFDINLEKWVEDTEGMSIAHLKELFINVCIFGNDYKEAVSILREMVENKLSSEDEHMGNIGFIKAKRDYES